MTSEYSIGETGVVMDTITVFKSQNGENIFIELKTEIDREPIISKRFSIKADKFRELIKDVL